MISLMKKDLRSPDLRSLREKRITSVSMPEQNSMRQEKYLLAKFTHSVAS